MSAKELTAAAVEALLHRAQLKHDEVAAGAVLVDGVVHKFGFHPQRLVEVKPEVDALLRMLPDQFRTDIGGGWSFLNACMDRDGRQWGEHRDIERLVCLGVGVGSATFVFPREMWKQLPGGMPYFAVHPDAAAVL